MLSQKDRKERLGNAKKIHVIDNSVESLLHQADEIAGFLKYYNFSNIPDGYFNQFLQDLKDIREKDAHRFVPDGNLEPSQALLFAFIQHLHTLGESFNQRFKDITDWYAHHFLHLRPLSLRRHKACLAFQKNVVEQVVIEKDFGFLLKENENRTFFYRILEDTTISNVSVENILAMYFCKQRNIYPASYLNFVTSLRVKDLRKYDFQEDAMFSTEGKSKYTRKLGFMITSSSLLLREGRRHVTIEFAFENITFGQLKEKFVHALSIIRLCNEQKINKKELLSGLQNNHDDYQQTIARLTEENPDFQDILTDLQEDVILQKILSGLDGDAIPYEEISEDIMGDLFLQNLFFLNISTEEGWKTVENYTVRTENENFTVEFSLAEDFPATSACETEIHKFSSKFPALSFLLNLDARWYSYSWMKYVLLKNIRIKTEAEDISNILIYNDLGKIDNAKPFNPFGINTEKGAWFTIGNYEMALKNTLSVDLKIEWGQLPDDDDGLYGYYKLYDKNIDNTSFKLNSRYLSDYQWKTDKTLSLFSTKPQQQNDIPYPNLPLSNVSRLENISVEKMPPIKLKEEDYQYHIQAQSGFVSFVLTEPEMGFGEKRYRTIFTDYIIKKNVRKRKKIHAPNPPLTPQIERITLSYKSFDEIDLRRRDSDYSHSEFYHVSPFGNYLIYPSADVDKVPLVYSMETDANIMVQLAGLKKGKRLNLYFDFFPANKEIGPNGVPSAKWYFGNGNQWEEIPSGYIVEDKTSNLLVNGMVKINVPENIRESLFDADQKIWLRVGIEKHEEVVSHLKNVYVNVAEAELKLERDVLKNDEALTFTGELEPERKIPGIESFKTISFYGGRKKETPQEMLMRMSEYVSHRGRGVTARDIERITLQEFPDMGKVKCLPNYNSKTDEKGVLTVVVIPEVAEEERRGFYKPMANSRQILNIEFLLQRHTSAYLKSIDVINPLYEEIMVRCKIKFHRKLSTAACRATLQEAFNKMIAPWQSEHQLPDFDCYLSLDKFRQTIAELSFVNEVSNLSILRISKKEKDRYEICEFERDDDTIKPSKPHAIFVPAKEHIILDVDSEEKLSNQFGVGEMVINESFILK